MDRELAIANIGVHAALEELEEWAAEQAARHRSEAYVAQMGGRSVIAATHIGREFAFQRTVARIQEMRLAITTSRDPRD